MNDAPSVIPSRFTVRNPSRVNVTMYSPGRRSTIRYSPFPPVVVVRLPSIREGLDASTVTSGTTASLIPDHTGDRAEVLRQHRGDREKPHRREFQVVHFSP